MKNLFALLLPAACLLAACTNADVNFQPAARSELRAPAYPLITIDPYTSAWSFANELYADDVRHWTGKKHPLLGVVRVDGKAYRFMGEGELPLVSVLPTAAQEKWDALYTMKEPAAKWTDIDFKENGWQQGKGAFGTKDMPNLSTPWLEKDIWVRRSFDLPEDLSQDEVILEYSHDDDFELYINGIKVIDTGYAWNNNVLFTLPDEVKKTLKPGKNIIAAHGHNKTGGAYVDFGLYRKDRSVKTFETAAVQTVANALPTQTFYTFTCGPVDLDVIFTSPLLMDDLTLMSTPVNYISYQVRPNDGKEHDVQMYIEATDQWAIDHEGQETETTLGNDRSDLLYAKTGTTAQPILQKKGDNVRIDWGYFYMASPSRKDAQITVSDDYHGIKQQFMDKGEVTLAKGPVRKTPQNNPVIAFTDNLGKVSRSSSGYVMLGYDDVYSIQYFHDNRMAYWKQNGSVSITDAFATAAKNYGSVMKRCEAFNTKLMADAEKAGGKKYAEFCALVYRQALAAHKLVTDKDGNLLFLSKENFSNGSIGTVDISYPSSPLFLLYNPELLKGMLTPIFYFSESGKWNKPFPSHDVGTYPQANGQTYGGDMPVEESGNMLIMTTAIALVEGNADFAKQHWPALTTWANYLLKEGLDPGNQLCTDDFAGHLAHNANLSIKAIMGIAGYGKLAEMQGDKETADKYIGEARRMALEWAKMADNGDHYRLTFDQPDTWSQKYNLIWDKLFGMNIFPKEIGEKEVNYYLTKQNPFGLPLDIRKDYTKSDWVMWSACLTDDMQKFDALFMPMYKYANETKVRVPISDWHRTTDASVMNFRARSVVGGYYMKMLEKKMTH